MLIYVLAGGAQIGYSVYYGAVCFPFSHFPREKDHFNQPLEMSLFIAC